MLIYLVLWCAVSCLVSPFIGRMLARGLEGHEMDRLQAPQPAGQTLQPIADAETAAIIPMGNFSRRRALAFASQRPQRRIRR